MLSLDSSIVMFEFKYWSRVTTEECVVFRCVCWGGRGGFILHIYDQKEVGTLAGKVSLFVILKGLDVSDVWEANTKKHGILA